MAHRKTRCMDSGSGYVSPMILDPLQRVMNWNWKNWTMGCHSLIPRQKSMVALCLMGMGQMGRHHRCLSHLAAARNGEMNWNGMIALEEEVRQWPD